jgi:hypothetical protein
MNQCLERDRDWIAYSKGALAQVRYDASMVVETAKAERLAFSEAMRGDYVSAAREQQSVVNGITDDDATQALQQQRLATYINFFDPSQAQQIQKTANRANMRLLRPLAGVQYERLKAASRPQAEQASSWLQARYESGNDLLLGFNALAQDLDVRGQDVGCSRLIGGLAPSAEWRRSLL